MIKDENYYVVKGWMMNRLGLKGTQLILYAILYGFSQDGKTAFKGSVGYLADFAGVTPTSCRMNLQQLQRHGLIRIEYGEQGQVNSYTVITDTPTDPLPQKPENKPVKKKWHAEAEEVITYLNTKTNSHYRATDGTTQGIIARLNEGFTVDDLKKVVDIKKADWSGTDFAVYLRPQTLFGSKFQSYLNQASTKRSFEATPSGKDYDDLDRRAMEKLLSRKNLKKL